MSQRGRDRRARAVEVRWDGQMLPAACYWGRCLSAFPVKLITGHTRTYP